MKALWRAQRYLKKYWLMAVGMFVGSFILVLFSKSSLKLDKGSYYLRVLTTGLLWGIGNYGALLMMPLVRWWMDFWYEQGVLYGLIRSTS